MKPENWWALSLGLLVAAGPVGCGEQVSVQDCNELSDSDSAPNATAWYPDGDGDGYGSLSGEQLSCQPLDGFVAQPGDCDDEDDNVHPGAEDLCDGIDRDCDGESHETDQDGDGFFDQACGGNDGNDDDSTFHPDAEEQCDGIDLDCDGERSETDQDGDGFSDQACGGNDCNDDNPLANPGFEEFCDGQDNNCDGVADEGFDLDSDGVTTCGADGVSGTADDDCDDSDPANFPTNAEICDGQDNDCVPASIYPGEDVDDDGDGEAPCAGDCDDSDPANFSANTEICDGQDNDCVPANIYPGEDVDDDSDGWLECADCDDVDPAFHPGAIEVCDGLDNDCNGSLPLSETADTDGDGVVGCADSNSSNPRVCSDTDGDNCDDCESGSFDPVHDGCDPVSADVLAAVEWARSIVSIDCPALAAFTGQVRQAIEPGAGESCPALTSVADLGPLWLGSCPYSVPYLGFPNLASCSGSSIENTYSGGCSTSSGALVSGSFVQSSDHAAASFSDPQSPAASRSRAEGSSSLQAGQFEVTGAAATTGSTISFFDGEITKQTEDQEHSPPATGPGGAFPGSGGSSVSSCDWNMGQVGSPLQVVLEGTPIGPALEGTSSFALSGLDSDSFYLAGFSFGDLSDSSSVLGTASLSSLTSHWEASFDTSISYSVMSTTGCPFGSGGPSCGCGLEPSESGTVTLDVYDSPGGALQGSFELQFHGQPSHTSGEYFGCDGCADLYQGGFFVRQICGGWAP